MAQKLDLKVKGLYLDPNALSEVPLGALEEADNIVIDQDSVAASRRGVNFYGSVLSDAPIRKLFNYRNSLLVHYDDKLAYDSNDAGTWVNYSGTYDQPDSDFKIRSIEANRNFYFTTSLGVKKLSAVNGTVSDAGMPRALDGTGSTTGASGFLSNSSVVAYRIVWGRKDINNNLIIGSPSSRIIVINNSGGTRNVSLSFDIPDGITTSDFYQLYRSPESGSLTVTPNDEMQQVAEGNPTSGEISSRSITITDSTPDDLKGAFLYTSPSQEGIANANEQPPFAKDVCVFKNAVFYANTKTKQRLNFTLISVNNPSFGYLTQTGNISTGLATVTALGSTTNLRVGMRVVGAGIPADTRILTIDSASQVTLNKNASATTVGVSLEFQDRITVAGQDYFGGSSYSLSTNQFVVPTSGTPAENIDLAAQNLVSIINKNTLNTLVYAYYQSGFEDLPGKILIEARNIGVTQFQVTSTDGSSFNPVLPSTGTNVSSSNEVQENRVYISKVQQPEAVPLFSYLDIGSADAPIKRIISLRDSVFIFKDDGVYRITGENIQSFSVSLFDNTVRLLAPESAATLSNQIYIFSDQAIVTVSDNGVQVVSRAIENELFRLSSSLFTNFKNNSFGIGYESERKYIFFTMTEETDVYPTQAFVYNIFTDSWTRWTLTKSCGMVNRRDNKLYLGDPANKFVYQERKNFELSDYADESYQVSIVSATGTTLVLNSTTNIQEGYTIKQGSKETVVIDVVNSTTIIVEKTLSWTLAAAEVFKPILNRLKWLPEAINNPGVLKQFREVTFLFRDASFRQITAGFDTNFSPIPEEIVLTPPTSIGAWGQFGWGQLPWGGGLGGRQTIRTFVPLEKQRAPWLNLSLELEQSFQSLSLEGVSFIVNEMSERFR